MARTRKSTWRENLEAIVHKKLLERCKGLCVEDGFGFWGILRTIAWKKKGKGELLCKYEN